MSFDTKTTGENSQEVLTEHFAIDTIDQKLNKTIGENFVRSVRAIFNRKPVLRPVPLWWLQKQLDREMERFDKLKSIDADNKLAIRQCILEFETQGIRHMKDIEV